MRYPLKQGHEIHDSRRVEALRRLLAGHKNALRARKRLLRDDISPEPGQGCDAVESNADNFARDLGAALVEVTARTVQGIEDALHRIKSGTYGVCLDCEASIPSLRLEALPFAERCRDCQQQLDSIAMSTRRPRAVRPEAGRSPTRGTTSPSRRSAIRHGRVLGGRLS
jgi:DnaK suppressor protein